LAIGVSAGLRLLLDFTKSESVCSPENFFLPHLGIPMETASCKETTLNNGITTTK
jgi:hypothetical protein